MSENLDRTLLERAFADVKLAMERSYFDQYEHDGFVASHHYSELGSGYKALLLQQNVDWKSYVEQGMHPDTPSVIVKNAAEGKPPERWLEGVGEPSLPPVQAEQKQVPEAPAKYPRGVHVPAVKVKSGRLGSVVGRNKAYLASIMRSVTHRFAREPRAEKSRDPDKGIGR